MIYPQGLRKARWLATCLEFHLYRGPVATEAPLTGAGVLAPSEGNKVKRLPRDSIHLLHLITINPGSPRPETSPIWPSQEQQQL